MHVLGEPFFNNINIDLTDMLANGPCLLATLRKYNSGAAVGHFHRWSLVQTVYKNTIGITNYQGKSSPTVFIKLAVKMFLA